MLSCKACNLIIQEDILEWSSSRHWVVYYEALYGLKVGTTGLFRWQYSIGRKKLKETRDLLLGDR